jgi:Coenzyme PQQ synthesis protein D (PqqD)
MQGSPEDLNHTREQGPSGPSLLPLAVCPKRRPDVQSRLIDGEAVVLDRPAGLIHQLNPTASYVWERRDGHSTVTDIAQQLAHAFDVDLTVATDDVRVLVRQLQDLHLLESADTHARGDRQTRRRSSA